MVNVTQFKRYNVIDSCAVSNLLSSKVLTHAAYSSGCHFGCTYFVIYEVLHKPHALPSEEKRELQRRFALEKQKGRFSEHHLDIDDLQEIDILRNRKRLSMGELSSIAWAKKTRQAILTDDQKARKLAGDVLGAEWIQTTPHLFGWLLFEGHLTDADKHRVIDEHLGFGRPLSSFFEEAYREATRCRLAAYQHSDE